MEHSEIVELSGNLTPADRLMLLIVAQFVRIRLSGNEGKRVPDSILFGQDDQAYRLAKGMGRLAVRKFGKYKIIPAGFYLWLKANRFLPHSFVIPLGGSTVEKLILNLRHFGVEAKSVLSYLEERRELRIKEYCSPELNRSFGTQQGTWTAIDNMRLMRHAHQPR
jgi:hypothetical protein